MAYRRKNARKTYRKAPAKKAYKRKPTKRYASKKRVAPRQQTIRIVMVQEPAATTIAPGRTPPPRRARF